MKKSKEKQKVNTEFEAPQLSKEKKVQIAVDYNLLIIIILLTIFGLVMLYSTSYYTAVQKFGNDKYFLFRQLRSSLVGFAVMAFVAFMVAHTRILKYRAVPWLIWFSSFVLMALVQTPIGFEANGARRWITVPLMGSIQPSESAKIAIIVVVAWYLSRIGDGINKLSSIIKVGLMGAGTALFIFLVTDHLSAAVIVLAITIGQALVVYKHAGPVLGFGIAGLSGVYFFVKALGEQWEKQWREGSADFDFRVSRLLVWLHPETHTDTGGYQIMQGMYAIGSGGFFGKGFGNSSQKLGFIPEVQNDMIIAIIIEELGVLGAIVVLTMFAYLLYRLLFIAQNAPDLYSSLIAWGIFIHIALQVILNLAVNLNIMPATGITLPFISYGGSSVVFLMAEMGIAMGISSRIKRQTMLDIRENQGVYVGEKRPY